MRNRLMVASGLAWLFLVCAGSAGAQGTCSVPATEFDDLYTDVTVQFLMSSKPFKRAEDWLKKNEKRASECAGYHFLWADYYAANKKWEQMEASYRRGLALGGEQADTLFANNLSISMGRAAAPGGDTSKLRGGETIPADLRKWFESVVAAGLEKWKDHPRILKLRDQRLPKQ